MARKRIADKEPAVVADGAAAAPANAPASRKSSETSKARAPRASANAVTHRHKKTAAQETAAPVIPAATTTEEVVSSGAGPAAAVAPAFEAAVSAATAAPVAAVPPTEDEIRLRAYFVWESRGYQGSEAENWLIAERMLSEERTAKR